MLGWLPTRLMMTSHKGFVMSHAVETIAYTNEVPWHGLGFHVAKAPSVKGMLKAAKIDWTVERKDVMTSSGIKIEGFAALTRSSDDRVLDIVGSKYVPTTNEQAFEFFKEFVEAGKAKMETAGSLREGRVVWGLAKLGTSFKMKGDDVVNGYLLCICPHQQGKSLQFRTTTVRVVCQNTLSMALGEGTKHRWSMGHRTAFDGVKVAQAKEALGIARDEVGEFEKNARLLQKLNLSKEDVLKILAPVYQPGVKKLDDMSPRMARLIDIYERAPGATPGNGYGVINAVTYYSDHIASRTADKRLTNAWMGKTAGHKEVVLAKLLEMAS